MFICSVDQRVIGNPHAFVRMSDVMLYGSQMNWVSYDPPSVYTLGALIVMGVCQIALMWRNVHSSVEPVTRLTCAVCSTNVGRPSLDQPQRHLYKIPGSKTKVHVTDQCRKIGTSKHKLEYVSMCLICCPYCVSNVNKLH